VLAFFAASDGIVMENLAARFLNDVQVPEVNFLIMLILTLVFFFYMLDPVINCWILEHPMLLLVHGYSK
jgi:hypothetical protein